MENLVEPPSFNAEEHIFDVAFHPTSSVFACTLVTGETKLVSYGLDKTEELITLDHHKKSARTCSFSPSGNYLATASEDRSIGIVDTNGDLIMKLKRAHDFPIYSLKFMSDEVIITGDDEGFVKVWNLKDGKCVWEVSEQESTITDMVCDKDNNFLLTTCTDGTLGVYDLRKANTSKTKLYALSDSMEEDLLSIALVKNGKKVLCSSQEGCIYVFKWGDFGDCKDRILGHPNSIDTMLKIDENTIITGSEDGYIRGVSIGPNKILSYLGNHSESDEVEAITRLAISNDGRYVASISYDNWVKFHNIASFVEQRGSLQNEDFDDDKDSDVGESNIEEEDDDDDDDDEDESRPKMPRKTDVKSRQREIINQKKKAFFSDI